MSVTVITLGVTTIAATAFTIVGVMPLVRPGPPTSSSSSFGAVATAPSGPAVAANPVLSANPVTSSAPLAPANPVPAVATSSAALSGTLVPPRPAAPSRALPFASPTVARSLSPPELVPLVNAVPTSTGWVWPVDVSPRVIRNFQPPPKNWLPGHRGVDLAVVPGDHVRAAGAGTVTFAGPLAGRGVVVVSHGALRTTYEPVTASVAVGDSVTAGQRIGVIAVGASHCGEYPSCLHWGLRRGDNYLDPLALLAMVHPVLLPLP